MSITENRDHTLTLADDARTERVSIPAAQTTPDPARRRRPENTDNQRAIVAAIEAGHTTLRAIMRATGINSTSQVAYNLRILAERDQCVLVDRGAVMLQVYDGRDYAAAWDTSARLSGNPDA